MSIHVKFFHRGSFVVFDPHSASGETSESDRMIQFANHVLHVTMHSYSRIQQHRYGSPGSVWKAVSQKPIDRHACFFHRGSFSHARSIASVSEKAQGAVPLVCSRSDASLTAPPSPWRPKIEQGNYMLFFRRLHDGFACGRKLKVHFLHGRSWWSCGTWVEISKLANGQRHGRSGQCGSGFSTTSRNGKCVL